MKCSEVVTAVPSRGRLIPGFLTHSARQEAIDAVDNERCSSLPANPDQGVE